MNMDPDKRQACGAPLLSILCLWALLFLAPIPSSATPLLPPSIDKGVNLFPMTADVLSTSAINNELKEISALGANWVVVNFLVGQHNATSNHVNASSKTPSDESMTSFISEAKALGLRIFLKPVVVCTSGCTMVNVTPSNATEWFESYTAYIVGLASFAERHQVDALAVGLELLQISGEEYTANWESVIASVRGVYSGLLTYCSIFYPVETQKVQFWKDLDFIGMDTYVPFMHNTSEPVPTFDQMVSRFKQYFALLDSWYKSLPNGVNRLPIVLTEVGYTSCLNGMANPAFEPPDDSCPNGTIWQANFTLQQMAFEALFTVLASPEAAALVRGVNIFWFDNPSSSDYIDGSGENWWPCSWTPRGKPALCTIADAFGGSCPDELRI